MSEQVPPQRLYKYRSFSDLTLAMLVEDEIYFADPTTFNDPLDTKPKLNPDLSCEGLEAILARLIEVRTEAEMAAAMKIIGYNGPKKREHISRQSRLVVERLLADISYNATNPDYEVDNPKHFLLGQYVEEELLRSYDRGAFSLAESADCPLMWSHYGDQHRGICLGYSVPADEAKNVLKMKYGGSRLVAASAVSAMLCGCETAKREVDEAVFLRKAEPWAYEREWRFLGSRGVQRSPLELEEVIFGMRCSPAVKFAVSRALEMRPRSVGFREVLSQDASFDLKICNADFEELSVSLPRRHRGILEMFRTERWGDEPDGMT